MPPDVNPAPQAPSPVIDPSLKAAIVVLQTIATEPLTLERCMQLTGAKRADVAAALRALECEAVMQDASAGGEARPRSRG